jgi:hypothetical protein
MDIRPFVDGLRQDLLVAAEAGGDEARALAERLTGPLDSAARLALLGALSMATDEITRDLAPGSVEVRLRGVDPTFVVTMAPADTTPTPVEPVTEDGPAARINFRPPESLKNRIDEAAARDGVSVNAWLVRVVGAALQSTSERPAPTAGTNHQIGWVR